MQGLGQLVQLDFLPAKCLILRVWMFPTMYQFVGRQKDWTNQQIHGDLFVGQQHDEYHYLRFRVLL